MIADIVCIIENHKTIPLPVIPKLLRNITSLLKQKKECVIANQISQTLKVYVFQLHSMSSM